jgi:hypothetical protein
MYFYPTQKKRGFLSNGAKRLFFDLEGAFVRELKFFWKKAIFSLQFRIDSAILRLIFRGKENSLKWGKEKTY